MNVLKWFGLETPAREQRVSEAKIRRVLTLFEQRVEEIEPGLWSVIAGWRDTYLVCLYIWADERRLNFMASCQLSMERELYLRDLLLTVLEENHRLEHGSFRLVPHDEKRLLVLGRTLDRATFSESELFHLGESLIERMQRMIRKLYGMELIVEGPYLEDEPEHSPFKRKEG